MAIKVYVDITYEGTSITSQISQMNEGFSYKDPAEGESDTITLSLSNTDRRWLNDWAPLHNDKINAVIYKEDLIKATKEQITCGSMTVDSVNYTGSPASVSIGGISLPTESSFKATKKTRIWQGITIAQCATQIAAENGMALQFYATDQSIITTEEQKKSEETKSKKTKEDKTEIPVDAVEQSDQTDSEFLSDICTKYGLVMKVYADKLLIYDELVLEGMDPVMTLTEADVSSWSYDSSIAGTYTGATLNYTDASTGTTYSASIGEGPRILQLNEAVSSNEEAKKVCIARCRSENKNMYEITFTPKDFLIISAACVVTLSGFGKVVDGDYFITSITHNVNTGGYSQSVSARKIVTQIGEEEVAKEATVQAQTYTVVSGDTLWAIAKKFYGNPLRWTDIYDANADLIESTAKSHGKKSSNHGHWIWPGETLTIPA